MAPGLGGLRDLLMQWWAARRPFSILSGFSGLTSVWATRAAAGATVGDYLYRQSVPTFFRILHAGKTSAVDYKRNFHTYLL